MLLLIRIKKTVGKKIREKIREKVGEKVGENLTENQKGILAALCGKPYISAREIAEIIDISERKTC